MLKGFNEKAKRVMFFARYEASGFGSRYVEPEHLLLGLLREDKLVCSKVIGSLSEIEAIRNNSQ
jgi:ATP-dependent Clp protease ATP-binding subunit ClpC